MTAVASFFIVFLSLLIYQHFGPRENKTLLRFVTDYLREYGLSKNIKDFASPRLLWTLTIRHISVDNQ